MSEELLCHHRHCYHRLLHHLKAGRTRSKCLIMTWEPTQLPPLPVEETCESGRCLTFNFWGPAVIIFPWLCECLCTGHVRAKVGMGVGEECCKHLFSSTPAPCHSAWMPPLPYSGNLIAHLFPLVLLSDFLLLSCTFIRWTPRSRRDNTRHN